MLYTGIDYHKRYSVVSTMDATGARISEARIEQNEPAAFAAYFNRLPEPSRVVVEACWNWGWLYDELGEIDAVADVVLAHPFKTRLIADAQIKTDRLDARALATLLRGNLVATVHAPTPANRGRPKRGHAVPLTSLVTIARGLPPQRRDRQRPNAHTHPAAMRRSAS